MSCRRAWASLALACLACVDLRPPKLEQSAGTIDQAKAVDAPKWVGLDARERGVGWHVHDLIHDRMGYALDLPATLHSWSFETADPTSRSNRVTWVGERGALSVASFTWSGSDLDPVGLYTMLEGLAKIGHDSYELGDAQPVPVELGGESGYHFIVEADGRRHDRTTYALLVTADGRELYEQVRGGFSFLD